MEKQEFIEAIEAIANQEDILETGRAASDLQRNFEDYILEATRQYQIAELTAEEKNEEFTQEDWMTPLKEQFYQIYGKYREKYKAERAKVQAVEEENLRQKRTLIAALKTLISEEEHIGRAFGKHKEISEKWKEIGDIPRNNRHEIQKEYSHLQEEFFYNINIYKEIKDYDFQKNQQAKEEVVEKLKALLSVEKIKDVEAQLKSLQNLWEDIGPTKQELWKEIKDRYWDAVNKVYEKLNAFYDERREERKQNLTHKEELIQKMNGVLQEERNSIKTWNKQTDIVLDIQKKWKSIGFGPSRKEDDAAWKSFRTLCDQFFDEKSSFFEGVHDQFEKVAEKKKELIEKVNQLKDNEDWKLTTNAIINIQKEWKRAGNAGRKFEQKLWKEFRSACDYFFEKKEKHFASLDQEFEENLTKKEHVIEAINAFQLTEDKNENIQKLREFSEQFAAIGFVPRQQKDAIYNAYKTALNKHYDSLDLQGKQKDEILFKAKLNTIKGSGNAAQLFQKERQSVRNQMNVVKGEIMQLENNLGFFASSKGENPLKTKVENDIQAKKKEFDALREKLKMIPNE